jgi:uncharacterized membrane protein
MRFVPELIPWVMSVLELAGIAVISLGALLATISVARRLIRSRAAPVYAAYRQQLSRGILIGLELLVAADIVGTIAIEPSFRRVGILGLIVVIRTVLSFTLEVEVTGRWPWQHREAGESGGLAGGLGG